MPGSAKMTPSAPIPKFRSHSLTACSGVTLGSEESLLSTYHTHRRRIKTKRTNPSFSLSHSISTFTKIYREINQIPGWSRYRGRGTWRSEGFRPLSGPERKPETPSRLLRRSLKPLGVNERWRFLWERWIWGWEKEMIDEVGRRWVIGELGRWEEP